MQSSILEDVYSVPTISTIDKFGRIEVAFSSSINVPTLEQFYSNVNRRILEGVDVEFDESFTTELTEASGLD